MAFLRSKWDLYIWSSKNYHSRTIAKYQELWPQIRYSDSIFRIMQISINVTLHYFSVVNWTGCMIISATKNSVPLKLTLFRVCRITYVNRNLEKSISTHQTQCFYCYSHSTPPPPQFTFHICFCFPPRLFPCMSQVGLWRLRQGMWQFVFC